MDQLSSLFGREGQTRGPSAFVYHEGGDLPFFVAPLESTAHRVGVLEKASKEFLNWKPRRCVLMSEVLCYSKGEAAGPAKTASPSKGSSSSVVGEDELAAQTWIRADGRKTKQKRRWTCIPLNNCIHIVALPHDPRIFLLQTKARAYYWRAARQTECEAWLAAIAAQCTLMHENDLLREAEERIVREEEQRASQMLACLESLRQLEGALLFSDTRELLEGLAVDYFRSREEQQLEAERALQCKQGPTNLAGGGPQQDAAGYPLPDKSDHLPPALTECDKLERKADNNKETRGLSSVTAGEVLSYIRSYEAHRGGVLQRDQPSVGIHSSRSREIHRWIKSVLFPLFMTSPIVQRRVAQLAASHNVISWGCDPLRGPLLWIPDHTDANADFPREEVDWR